MRLSDCDNQRTTKESLIEFVLILSLLAMASPLLAFANTQATDAKEDKAPRTQVSTTRAKQTDWPVSIPAQGEVLPWEVAIISAKSSGIGATQVAVVEGDSVRKGQLLAAFDTRLLKAQLAEVKANLALASANYQLAASNLKRAEQLKQKHALSEQEFEQVANQTAAAGATRDQVAAAVTLAEIKLADATLTAPDNGKVLERNIDLGQVPAVGEPLFRILRQNKLEWIAEIDASDLQRVKQDLAAEIHLANGKILKGKIRSASPQLSSSSRLAKVRIVLEGSADLAVNTYVAGKILVGTATAVTIPSDSLVIKDGKTWVFRVRNAAVEQVLVSIGRQQKNEIEIVSGISAGDTVVVEGSGFLNDGDKITLASAKAGDQP